MLHGIWDAIRNNADKLLDNALGLLRDTFILILGVHYRNHILRRKAEAKDYDSRHAATEEQVRELRDWMESEKGRKTDNGGAQRETNGLHSGDESHSRGGHRVRRDKD